MFINEIVSIENTPVMKLKNEKILFNDINIFFLRIFFV
jgi:hypothetical protein